MAGDQDSGPRLGGEAADAHDDLVRRALLVVGFAAFVLVVLALSGRHTDFEPSDLLRDPAASVGFPAQTGALSHLGVLLWITTAAVLGFSSQVATQASTAHRAAARSMAALAGWLGIDDLFLLHEDLVPDLLGVSEKMIFVVYASVSLAMLVRHRAVWFEPENRSMLGIVAIAMATSIVVDLAEIERTITLEDGAKLVGIFALAVWAVGFGRALVEESTAPAMRKRPAEDRRGV